LDYKIPLPTLKEQETIVANYYAKIKKAEELQKQANEIEREIEKYLFEELGISEKGAINKHKGIQLISFESIKEWGIDKILAGSNNKSSKFQLTSIDLNPTIALELFRGKSPKYKENTNSYILNQKCNRWNQIDLSFVKSVDEDWLKSIDKNSFTKEGDVLINSTGEGTIGRSSFITKEVEGFLYDSHILLLRLDKKIINAELFVEIFNSTYGQNQVNEIKSAQATKQTELGTSNLAKVQFPLIENILTQKKIVNTINGFRQRKIEKISTVQQIIKEAEQEFEQVIFK
jgi:restriction endonuclease S subunit